MTVVCFTKFFTKKRMKSKQILIKMLLFRNILFGAASNQVRPLVACVWYLECIQLNIENTPLFSF